ncbi:MAG TPA: polysaccharide deacetylase family protein, partial [Candidatus Sulfotelmatobacter sp.]|nr:polysaccharide deacetylase family protein [Candidatus Sulfotelmatobacter sp.]
MRFPLPASSNWHILSVDVEDYFQVEAFAKYVSPNSWEHWPPRVVANTRRVLGLFDRYHVTGTFFFVGWIADRFPALVREVLDHGHEIACHSYWHQCIYKLTPEEFKADTQHAVDVIENAGHVHVSGYRAPSWSITAQSQWALSILQQCGFTYDSSVFPIHHDIYGLPGAQRFPYEHVLANGSRLPEFPPTTIKIGKMILPAAGGGY